ncbi:hypothetical protein Taro_012206 [Colocasia esculenta]|uniref:Uncharacterized protein n=1 Tax=Colocasia esculenta TaxID=4460 RepID=A0A843UEZ6_COLES|nr:hypothetical protein [Colocasia esculenta]
MAEAGRGNAVAEVGSDNKTNLLMKCLHGFIYLTKCLTEDDELIVNMFEKLEPMVIEAIRDGLCTGYAHSACLLRRASNHTREQGQKGPKSNVPRVAGLAAKGKHGVPLFWEPGVLLHRAAQGNGNRTGEERTEALVGGAEPAH